MILHSDNCLVNLARLLSQVGRAAESSCLCCRVKLAAFLERPRARALLRVSAGRATLQPVDGSDSGECGRPERE
jgi:hypothetical protein